MSKPFGRVWKSNPLSWDLQFESWWRTCLNETSDAHEKTGDVHYCLLPSGDESDPGPSPSYFQQRKPDVGTYQRHIGTWSFSGDITSWLSVFRHVSKKNYLAPNLIFLDCYIDFRTIIFQGCLMRAGYGGQYQPPELPSSRTAWWRPTFHFCYSDALFPTLIILGPQTVPLEIMMSGINARTGTTSVNPGMPVPTPSLLKTVRRSRDWHLRSSNMCATSDFHDFNLRSQVEEEKEVQGREILVCRRTNILRLFTLTPVLWRSTLSKGRLSSLLTPQHSAAPAAAVAIHTSTHCRCPLTFKSGLITSISCYINPLLSTQIKNVES